MKRWLAILSILSGFSYAFADNSKSEHKEYVKTAQSVAFVSSALSKADVEYARSILNSSQLKGIVGENLAAKAIEKEFLSRTGWHAITPRAVLQGIDHLYIKFNRQHLPCDLMVSETKYGSSRLSMTLDGKQASDSWYSRRFQDLAYRYKDFSESAAVKVNAKKTLMLKNVIDIPLSNGKTVSFWRSGNDAFFSGSEKELLLAKKTANSIARYMNAVAENKISYRSRLYQVSPGSRGYHLKISDLQKANVSVKSVPAIELNVVPNFKNLSRSIAGQLKSKMTYLSDREVKLIARDVSKDFRALTGPRTNVPLKFLNTSLLGAGITMAVVATQQAVEGKMDFKLVGQYGLASALSVGGVQCLSLAAQRSAYLSFMSRGMSAGLAGLAVAPLLAYGSYAIGDISLAQAHRMTATATIGGVAGLAAGYGVSAGVPALIAAYGTASTGTAISTLGGAAATNATTAWLGGGAVAAGGGGMAVGGAVMTAGVAVVAAATAFGVYKAVDASIDLYDRSKENKEYISELQKLKGDDSALQKLILRDFQMN